MILKSLKLENIRSYQAENIDFPEGSLLLSGDIGTGKSTILQAIEFALFGTMLKQLSAESLLRHGENQGSVELKFNLGGEDITVKRNLKREKDSIRQQAGYIVKNDTKTEATAIELKTKILELLGYPQDLVTKSKSLIYRYTVYTPQEDMKSIIYDDKESRLNTLRKVFGIDKYKLIKENTSIYIRTLKEKQKELGGRYADLAQKQKNKQDYQDEFNKFQEEINKLKPIIQDLKQKITKKQQEMTKNEEEVQKYLDASKKLGLAEEKLFSLAQQTAKQNEWIAKVESELAEIDSKLSTITINEESTNTDQIEKEIEELQQQIQSKEKKESEFKATLKSINETINKTQDEILSKESHLKDLDRTKEDIKIFELEIKNKKLVEQELEIITKELDKIKADIKECEVNIDLSEKTKEKILKLDNCPTCIQPVTKDHKKSISEKEDNKIAKFKKDKEEFENELTQKEIKIKSLKDKLVTLQEKEKNYIVLKSELENLKKIHQDIELKKKEAIETNQKKGEIERQINSLSLINVQSLLSQIKERREILKKYQETMLKIKEKNYLKQSLKSKHDDKKRFEEQRERLNEEIKAIKKLRITLEQKVGELGGVENSYKLLKLDMDALLAQEKEVEIKQAQLLQSQTNIKKVISELDEEINLKLCFKDKAVYISQLQNWLEEYFIKLVTLMEKQIMSKVYYQFNDLFSNWFNLLIEDEILNTKLDEEFTPVIIQNGYETNVHSLSGGEKTALALAYRLALNKVINDVISDINTKDLIILDEPTDGFSTEQLDRVRDVIHQLNMRQVIVVSHESKVESFVDNTLRISKNNHISSVS